MQHSALFLALAASASASILPDELVSSQLISRQTTSEEDYINSVCQPNTTDTIAPCQAIINIEQQCQPNGTSSVDYIAHQECMCGGGFFDNWSGCQQCQYVHGARSDDVVEAFESIISSASVALCTGTPTASFAEIFASISQTAVQQVDGAPTSVRDQYPSETAVSLYFTASGPQGAGAITGNAAAATRTGSASSSASIVTPSVSQSTASGSSFRSSVASSGSSASARSTGSSQPPSGSATTSESSSSSSASAASSSSTGAAARFGAAGGAMVVAAGGFLAFL